MFTEVCCSRLLVDLKKVSCNLFELSEDSRSIFCKSIESIQIQQDALWAKNISLCQSPLEYVEVEDIVDQKIEAKRHNFLYTWSNLRMKMTIFGYVVTIFLTKFNITEGRWTKIKSSLLYSQWNLKLKSVLKNERRLVKGNKTMIVIKK